MQALPAPMCLIAALYIVRLCMYLIQNQTILQQLYVTLCQQHSTGFRGQMTVVVGPAQHFTVECYPLIVLHCCIVRR